VGKRKKRKRRKIPRKEPITKDRGGPQKKETEKREKPTAKVPKKGEGPGEKGKGQH